MTTNRRRFLAASAAPLALAASGVTLAATVPTGEREAIRAAVRRFVAARALYTRLNAEDEARWAALPRDADGRRIEGPASEAWCRWSEGVVTPAATEANESWMALGATIAEAGFAAVVFDGMLYLASETCSDLGRLGDGDDWAVSVFPARLVLNLD